MRVKVIIHEDHEEGGFWAEVPAVPGCVSEGETRDEVLRNLREALEGVLLTTSGVWEPVEEGEREEVIDLS
jgi:predicted RNase H-like HicB family nuclease